MRPGQGVQRGGSFASSFWAYGPGGGGVAFSFGLDIAYIWLRVHEHQVIQKVRWGPHGASFCLPLLARRLLVGVLPTIILLSQTF